MRHTDEEDMGHLQQQAAEMKEATHELARQAGVTIKDGEEDQFIETLSGSDAGPAATPRAEADPTPLEQAIERTSRHADTPSKPRHIMNAVDRRRAARIAWAAWREASDLLGNDRLPLWDALNPQQVDACEAMIERMADKPFGAAGTRQEEIFQAIAYTVAE
jgi:hypothetical protein